MTPREMLLAELEIEIRRPIPPRPGAFAGSQHEADLLTRIARLRENNRRLSKRLTSREHQHEIVRARLEARVADLEDRALHHRCWPAS